MKFALIGAVLTAAMLAGYMVGDAAQTSYGATGALVLWLLFAGGAFLALRGMRGK